MPPHDTVDRLRSGWIVFAILAALTAVEIGISVSFSPNGAFLLVTSLAKAALIVYYFMRVSNIREGEE